MSHHILHLLVQQALEVQRFGKISRLQTIIMHQFFFSRVNEIKVKEIRENDIFNKSVIVFVRGDETKLLPSVFILNMA